MHTSRLKSFRLLFSKEARLCINSCGSVLQSLVQSEVVGCVGAWPRNTHNSSGIAGEGEYVGTNNLGSFDETCLTIGLSREMNQVAVEHETAAKTSAAIIAARLQVVENTSAQTDSSCPLENERQVRLERGDEVTTIERLKLALSNGHLLNKDCSSIYQSQLSGTTVMQPHAAREEPSNGEGWS